MIRNGFLLFVIAIAIGGVLTWLNTYWLTVKSFQFSKNEKKIDYYLSDFTLLNTYSDGQMRYRVKGQHLVHQQQSGGSEIFKPLIQARDNDGTLLTIQSEKAEQKKKDGDILLLGQVEVLKTSSNPTQSFQLKTQNLLYNPTNKTLSSEYDVSLKSYSGTIKGTGFNSNLDEQALRIFSNVHIEYRPTQ